RPPAGGSDLDPGDHDREQHPRRADLVATPRLRRVREEAQRQDERDDRDQVEEVREVVAHVSPGLLGRSRLLNISSIRSVTTKPPTTFAAARTTAAKPTIQVNALLSGWPRTIIAPTITTPWIAFVPDISGVCSSVGTLEITSTPRKIASTRIVTSKTRIVLWLTRSPPAFRRRRRRS